MGRPRLPMFTVFVLLAVAGLAPAACTAGSADPDHAQRGTGVNQAELQAAILASLHACEQTSAQVSLTQGPAIIHATTNPAGKRVRLSQTSTDVTTEVTWVSPDVWLKYDLGHGAGRQLGIDPNVWMKLDVSQLADPLHKLLIDVDTRSGDPFDLAGLLVGLQTVQHPDPAHYTGTVDLTRARGPIAFADSVIRAVSDKVTWVPFTVQVDDQGRLTHLKIDASAVMRQLVIEITISDYGTSQTITQPNPADTTSAPPALYALFNT